MLRWLAQAYAYLWLLTDAFPSRDSASAVELDVNPSGVPSPSAALLRLVTTLPALLLLLVLSVVACVLWPIGAVCILVGKRLPDFLFDFFLLTLRGQFRLIAYHLALVDRYPSFEEGSGTGDTFRSPTI